MTQALTTVLQVPNCHLMGTYSTHQTLHLVCRMLPVLTRVSVDAGLDASTDNGAADTQLPLDGMDIFNLISSPSPSNSAPCAQDAILPSEEDYGADNDDSILRFPDNLPCDCDSPTLATLEWTLGQWRKLPLDKPQIQWHSQYEDELKCAQETSKDAFNKFYKDTFTHVTEGSSILEAIQDVISMPCPRCREGLKYDIPLLYDMLTTLLTKLEFYSFVFITSFGN